MTAPKNHEQFLALVRGSKLVDEALLQHCLQQLRQSGQFSNEPMKLAGLLVRDGILTIFQAEQLLLGRWRNFTTGDYSVLERLGSGDHCSVYLCKPRAERRLVAVKVLPARSAESAAAVHFFGREARALAALNHPNLGKCIQTVTKDRLHFLVMEFIDGATLKDIITDGGRPVQFFPTKHGAKGPMNIVRAAHYVSQAAHGLHSLHHDVGLVHGDVEPGNLLLDRRGRITIIDLGMSRFLLEPSDRIASEYRKRVRRQGSYAAPEEILDDSTVDVRADIYGLGAVFYFLLAGWPPVNNMLASRPIRDVRLDVPQDYAGVLERMMAMNPADRYQTAAEVIEALAPWTRTIIPAPPIDEMPRYCPVVMELLGA